MGALIQRTDAPVQQAAPTISPETLELVLGKGDLSKLTAGQRVEYLSSVCRSLNLNPLTQPFSIQDLGGKTVLYARRDATDQLRQVYGVTCQVVSRERVDDLMVVTVKATDLKGRSDEAIGAVSVINLKGESLANALMKAETKAKRRATLSLCGLGIVDETEIDSVQIAAATPLPHAPELPWKTRGEMLRVMAEHKLRVGDEPYYRVLAEHGMEEAEQIKDKGVAAQIHTQLSMVPPQAVTAEEVA